MSYEDAIEAMRGRNVEPAPLQRLREKQSAAPPPLPRTQVSVAAAATVVAATGFLVLLFDGQTLLRLAPMLPLLLLGWAVVRVRESKLGSQLLCRAVWWSSLVVGLLVSLNYGATADKAAGAIVAVGCAVALLVVGETGLDTHEPNHPFAPVRFRGHLLLALVMAAADALTLAFSGLMQLRFGAAGWNLAATVDYAGPTVTAAAVMGLAVWGVYRLRTWALLLNLVANIAIAYLALEGTLQLSPSVSVSLAATAAIQCFIPVPILAAALGDRGAGQPLFAAGRRWLMRGLVVAIAGFSMFAATVPSRGDGWVDGPGRAFVRGHKARRHPPRADVDRSGPRSRLGATAQDLRGWSFEEEPLAGAEFIETDLRGASFVNAGLRGVDFSSAKLDGADFRGAFLSHATFSDASLDGADFTGALASTLRLSKASGTVTCPNGEASSPTEGCEGKLGHVVSFSRKRLTVVRAEDAVGCPSVGHTSVTEKGRDEYLRVLGRPYVTLADGRGLSSWGTVTIDGETWTLESPLCGRIEFAAAPAPIPHFLLGQYGTTYPAGGNLRGADFSGLLFTNVLFEGKALVKATFRGADLRESEALFVGADLREADFTGAFTQEQNWEGTDAASLAGARCPDGRGPDAKHGCATRRGTFDGALPDGVTWESPDCVGTSAGHFSMNGEFLALDGVPFVALHDGRFVSPRGKDHTMTQAEDGAWVVSVFGCAGRASPRPQ